jgi:SAM-dependent methyltransferase
MRLVPIDRHIADQYLASRRILGQFNTQVHADDEMYSILTTAANLSSEEALITYFDSGFRIWEIIREIVQTAGLTELSQHRVLEFACGFGRVTRWILQDVPADHLLVSDVQAAATEFQKRNFHVRAVDSDPVPSKVDLNGEFELIAVVSLFSHLPLHRFSQWLKYLYSLVSEDGMLIFTVHPLSMVDKKLRTSGGFSYQPQRLEQNQIASNHRLTDMEEYGTTCATTGAVREIASNCGIPCLYSFPRGLLNFQDLYVASRKPISSLNSWQQSRHISGKIESLVVSESNVATIRGWSLDYSRFEQVRTLKIWLNGIPVEGHSTLNGWRPDLAQSTGNRALLHAGWDFVGSPGILADGSLLVMAEVDGVRISPRRLSIDTAR